MERAGSFDEDKLVAKFIQKSVLEQSLRVSKEIALGIEFAETCFVLADGGSHSHQTVDTSALEKFDHMRIEHHWGHSTLQDVAENEGTRAALPFRTTAHEIEGDVQAVEIAIVGVVYQRALVSSLQDLKPHSHRFQMSQTLLDDLLLHAQIAANGSHNLTIVAQGVSLVVPRNQLTREVQLRDTICHQLIIGRIDEGSRIMEEDELFHTLLPHVLEILLMG